MSTQVQFRRDSTANLALATPAEGEIGVDTTRKGLIVGDGSTAGGILIPSISEIQGSTGRAGLVSGTNTLTVTMDPAIDAYATYQSFFIEIANDNTGSATLNVNGQGPKTIQKVSPTGLQNLSADELQAGGIYQVVYDGTVFVIIGQVPGSGVDIQEFTSSGTWTKPASGTATLIEIWGAGGAGGSESDGGGGGGGGGYNWRIVATADLGSSETVTIGAGVSSNAGGNSTFGTHITGYGGGAGTGNTPAGGGGGGPTGKGNNATSGTAGTGNVHPIGANGHSDGYYGAGGAADGGNGPDTFFGGAGGAADNGSTGGTSIHGGDGGAPGAEGGAADGTQPGGGGGGFAHASTNGGIGGDGMCIVTTW